MNLWKAAWTIARKDLRIYFRDRTGMLLGFALPLVLVGAFGFVMKFAMGKEGGLEKSTLWVADLDGSPKSREFVEALRGASTVRVQPKPGEKAPSAEELRKKVEDGEAHHALLVEAGFGEAIEGGRLPRLRMFRDPGREMESQMISVGLLQAFFSTAGGKSAPILTARALQLMGLPEEWHERILAIATGFSSGVEGLFTDAEKEGRLGDGNGGPDFQSVMTDFVPVERVDLKPPGRPKNLSYMLAHVVSGTGVMMLMFGLVACASLLIREREQKTLDRIRLAAAPGDSLLLGKVLFAGICGALQLVLLFAFGSLVFDVSALRDPATLIVVSLATLLAINAFGMLIATWAGTQKQAEGVSTLIILVMSALGGAWFPVQLFDLPLPAQIVTKCTLTHWAVSAYQGMFWYGKAWTDPAMLGKLSVLLAFALVAGLAARALYRRRYVGV